jgi:hypothetical protein
MYRAIFYDSDKKPMCYFTDANKDKVERHAAKTVGRVHHNNRSLVISYEIKWEPRL